MSKYQRLKAIQDVVSSEHISTQSELVERLRQLKFEVTQATVSRDINELRLVRVPVSRGKHKYALSGFDTGKNRQDELEDVFGRLVFDVDRGENVLVVKVSDGHATGVALVIDRLDREDIVGTIAGQDSIMVVVRNTELAIALEQEFGALLG